MYTSMRTTDGKRRLSLPLSATGTVKIKPYDIIAADADHNTDIISNIVASQTGGPIKRMNAAKGIIEITEYPNNDTCTSSVDLYHTRLIRWLITEAILQIK
jgi:hypothetical protein